MEFLKNDEIFSIFENLISETENLNLKNSLKINNENENNENDKEYEF
jgi:hypothetical protein